MALPRRSPTRTTNSTPCNALQARFLPLVEQVRALKIDIDSTRSRLEEIKPDGAAVAEQETRFAELVETSRILGTELAERTHNMQALAEELARSDNLKNMLLSELDLVQSRQRDTVGQIEACEDQLARAERMFKQLEERRVQITIGEKKLAAVEARLADIRQVSDELDRSHQAIASREQLVSAVKAEVEAVHLISARSKADLDYVMQHRGEVAALKMQVDRLSSRIAETDQRVVSIDARRKLLEEVENKANVILELAGRRANQRRDDRRAKGGRGPGGSDGCTAGIQAAGGAEHPRHAAARTRAGRAPRARNQAAFLEDSETRRSEDTRIG